MPWQHRRRDNPLIVRVFKGMARIREDYHFDTLIQPFHLLFKLVNGFRGDSLILSAENSQNGRVDLLQSCGFCGQVSVIDYGRGEFGS